MSMAFILSAEAAAAFDRLTRSGRDELLTRQVRNAWPNVFRASRLIPAVEYINANRARSLLIDEFNEMMQNIDVLISPTFGTSQLSMTNLTGHPALVIPNGSYAKGDPGTITLIGNHFDETSILLLGRFIQDKTGFDEEFPGLFLSE
jgi:Asp-tRNA(Asn)/Glu-tRNA(Gln) amidotransferase A subunit family amidase